VRQPGQLDLDDRRDSQTPETIRPHSDAAR
jgi:hypothetical protein